MYSLEILFKFIKQQTLLKVMCHNVRIKQASKLALNISVTFLDIIRFFNAFY